MTFGGERDDRAGPLRQTTDGGYILAEAMEFFDLVASWLVKLSLVRELWNECT